MPLSIGTQNGRDAKNGPYNTGNNSDFRSPENLHEYILGVFPESCPLLTSFMSRRELKRSASGVRIREAAIREVPLPKKSLVRAMTPYMATTKPWLMEPVTASYCSRVQKATPYTGNSCW